jgi:MerR family transcriptional regulator, copper efflux regulator
MNIGEAARRAGLPAKTIRYYEDVRLVPAPKRRFSNYREYSEQDVHRLRFIARARRLGFSMAEIRHLLALYEDRERASADVKRLVLDHVAEVERRIAELETMRRALLQLAERCHGDERPDCPILDDLAAGGAERSKSGDSERTAAVAGQPAALRHQGADEAHRALAAVHPDHR